MRINIYLFIVSLALISCNSNIKQGESEVAFVVDEIDLIPEGITFDAKTNRFFLSSKNKDKVIAIDQLGNYKDFITSRQDSMLSSLGLKIDVERRRLWAVSNRLFSDGKVSAVHVFNADNGELIKRFFTPFQHQYHLNDLILTDSGDAYITDTQSDHIFTIPADLSRLTVFMTDSLISAPNGIALSPDNSILYIESHYNGILLVNISNKTVRPIGNPMSLETGGIDGLMYYKNSLICIANSQHENFDYIVRYQLSKNGCEIIAASVIDKANPAFLTPTTGVIADDCLYVLAATCLGIYNSNQMDQKDMLKNPLVLKYQLN